MVGQQIMMVVKVILVQVGWSGRSINHRWTPDVPAWNKPPPTVFYVLSWSCEPLYYSKQTWRCIHSVYYLRKYPEDMLNWEVFLFVSFFCYDCLFCPFAFCFYCLFCPGCLFSLNSMSSISSTPLRFFSLFSSNNQLLGGVISFAAKMWLNTVQLQTMEKEYDLKSVCNESRGSRTLVVSANNSSDLDGKDWNQISIFSNIKCYLRCVYFFKLVYFLA